MMRLSSLCLAALSFSAATGCATSGSVSGEAGGVAYSFTYKTVGIAKYDNFLQSTKTLIDQLDQADASINSLVPSLKQAAAAVGDATGATIALGDSSSFSELFTKLVGSVSEAKLTIYVEATESALLVRVKASAEVDGGIVTKANDAFNEVNAALGAIAKLPADLSSAVDTAAGLADQVKGLTGSLKTDFTGMKAMKIPAATSALGSAGAELGKVPARVAKLLESAGALAKDLQGLAGGA